MQSSIVDYDSHSYTEVKIVGKVITKTLKIKIICQKRFKTNPLHSFVWVMQGDKLALLGKIFLFLGIVRNSIIVTGKLLNQKAANT